jgi:succinate dehydrogenase / fumarate reductase cytochrome b subunit
MSLKRNVNLFSALRYKGYGPMLAYLLHRIAGIGLFIFLTTYILALAGVGFIYTLYANWLFQVLVLFCVLFHAINGLRITILDLWPNLIHYQRQVIRVEWFVFVAVYGFAVFVITRTALGG